MLSSLHVVAFPKRDDDAREADRASQQDERLETKTKKLALFKGVVIGGILEERSTRVVDFHRHAGVYVSVNGARRALRVDDGRKDDVGGSFRGEHRR